MGRHSSQGRQSSACERRRTRRFSGRRRPLTSRRPMPPRQNWLHRRSPSLLAHPASPALERYMTNLFLPSLTLVRELCTVLRWLFKKNTNDVSPCAKLHTTDWHKANLLCGQDQGSSREQYSGAMKTTLFSAPTTLLAMLVPLSTSRITNNWSKSASVSPRRSQPTTPYSRLRFHRHFLRLVAWVIAHG